MSMKSDRSSLNSIISNIEQEYAPIQQHHVEKLFKDIYFFVERSFFEAAKKNKPCLFIIGELHNFGIGKNSLFVEYIFSEVISYFGIKTIYSEGWEFPRIVKDVEDPISIAFQKSKYFKLSEDVSYIRTYLYNKLIKEKKFTYKLAEAHEVNTFVNSGYEVREQTMVANLLLEQASTIFICGSFHAPAIFLNANINNKFEVYLVNTIYDKVLDKFAQDSGAFGKEFALVAKKRDDILKKATTFLVRAQLLDVTSKDVFNMVDKAKMRFDNERENDNSLEKVTSLEMMPLSHDKIDSNIPILNNHFYEPQEGHQLPGAQFIESSSSFSGAAVPAVLSALAAYSLFKAFSCCRRKVAYKDIASNANNSENKVKIQ
jgi:hypothetical protein